MKNILGKAKHGVRAKHFTETQLLVTSHDLLKPDFSKVFDS